jgi:hypothetical protein
VRESKLIEQTLRQIKTTSSAEKLQLHCQAEDEKEKAILSPGRKLAAHPVLREKEGITFMLWFCDHFIVQKIVLQPHAIKLIITHSVKFSGAHKLYKKHPLFSLAYNFLLRGLTINLSFCQNLIFCFNVIYKCAFCKILFNLKSYKLIRLHWVVFKFQK